MKKDEKKSFLERLIGGKKPNKSTCCSMEIIELSDEEDANFKPKVGKIQDESGQDKK